MTDTNKMDPTWKAKWLEALRSGDYEQGQGLLRTNEGSFCCLGVLTDLVVKEGHGSWIVEHGDPDTEGTNTYVDPAGDYCSTSLTHELEGIVGLREEVRGADVAYYGVTIGDLIDMNDSGGYTFLDIAQRIEEAF